MASLEPKKSGRQNWLGGHGKIHLNRKQRLSEKPRKATLREKKRVFILC